MKIFFITSDNEVKELGDSLSGHSVDFSDDLQACSDTDLGIFRLVFLDVGGDAEEVNLQISKLQEVYKNPFVLLSTLTVKEIRSHQRSDFAADAYLTRPVTKESLLDTISDFVDATQSASLDSDDLEEDSDLDIDTSMDLDMDTSMDLEMDTSMDLEMDTSMDLDMDTSMDLEMDADMDLEMDADMDLDSEKSLAFNNVEEATAQTVTEDLGEDFETGESTVSDAAISIDDDSVDIIGGDDEFEINIDDDNYENTSTQNTLMTSAPDNDEFSSKASATEIIDAGLSLSGMDIDDELLNGSSNDLENSVNNQEETFSLDVGQELTKVNNTGELSLNEILDSDPTLHEFQYSKTDTPNTLNSHKEGSLVYDELDEATKEIDTNEMVDEEFLNSNISAIDKQMSNDKKAARKNVTIPDAILAIPTVQEMANHVDVHLDQDAFIRAQSTIRDMKEERDRLFGKINDLETENRLLDQDNLSTKAELEEISIELNIIKKRQSTDQESLKEELTESEEKKLIYEEKMKRLEKDFDKLNQKVRFDINKVRQRERDLEGQLELVKMDAESQIKTRDAKILDLKRKIDALEFNIENSSIKEQKSLTDKYKMEEKISKVMQTLKRSMKLIEEDIDISLEEEQMDIAEKV